MGHQAELFFSSGASWQACLQPATADCSSQAGCATGVRAQSAFFIEILLDIFRSFVGQNSTSVAFWQDSPRGLCVFFFVSELQRMSHVHLVFQPGWRHGQPSGGTSPLAIASGLVNTVQHVVGGDRLFVGKCPVFYVQCLAYFLKRLSLRDHAIIFREQRDASR